MDRLMIEGTASLAGEIPISGAKNAALPCLAATILTRDAVHLTNLPAVRDIETMCSLLAHLGLSVNPGHEAVTVGGAGLNSCLASYDMVKTMRASILVLGPLLARTGKARVSLPGGCAIGARPVDLHLQALQQMGAEITVDQGYIDAQCQRLQGADIFFEKVTVTGTENIMMAACLAEGTTVLYNAAREPEVVDLAEMLIQMGARIQGHGTATISIRGVRALHGAHHHILPDRIETATYVCAAAITMGHVAVTHTRSDMLIAFLEVMRRAGLRMKIGIDFIEVFKHTGLTALEVATQPHPGFPTDAQAQLMAVLTQAYGCSRITETIFENRFMHTSELARMGARIHVRGRTAIVDGRAKLSGATVMATDLRASACLVLAGLAAEGQTIIDRIYHLDRGYSNLELKLLGVGAKVERLSDTHPGKGQLCLQKTDLHLVASAG